MGNVEDRGLAIKRKRLAPFARNKKLGGRFCHFLFAKQHQGVVRGAHQILLMFEIRRIDSQRARRRALADKHPRALQLGRIINDRKLRAGDELEVLIELLHREERRFGRCLRNDDRRLRLAVFYQ